MQISNIKWNDNISLLTGYWPFQIFNSVRNYKIKFGFWFCFSQNFVRFRFLFSFLEPVQNLDPNDSDKLIIFRRGCVTSGSTSFSILDGIGSNIHVVDLDNLISLYNSSSPKETNEWNCSTGDL